MNDNGSFASAVKIGKIKQPTQIGFSEKKWTKAFRSFRNVSKEDEKLYFEGLWFFNYLSDIRSELHNYNDKVSDLIILRQMYVGLINRDFCVAETTVSDFLEKNSEKEFLLGELAEKKFPSGVEGYDVNIIAVVESSSSAVRFPLSETFRANNLDKKVLDNSEFLRILHARINLAALYSYVSDMWGECLWNNWSIEETEKLYLIQPPKTAEASCRVIAQHRFENLIAEFGLQTMKMWGRIPDELKEAELNKKRIISVERKGKKKVLKLGNYDDEHLIIHELGMAIAAEEQYWNELLEMPMPNYLNLSTRDMIEVWGLFSSLGRALKSKLPADTGIFKISKLIQFAPTLKKSEIISAIKKTTGFPHAKVLSIIDLCTFSGDIKDDPWLKPFIPLDKDYFCFLLPSMIVTNRIRLIESWMREGGIDIQKGGSAFENYVRREVEDNLNNSEYLRSTFVSPKSVVLSNGDQEEEIDFIWIVGSLIIIGEIKCSFFPTSPLEFHNFFNMLDSATSQAKRKADFVRKNLLSLSILLEDDDLKNEENISVAPLVITNLPYGPGFPMNGVSITDLRIMNRFIEGYQVVGPQKIINDDESLNGQEYEQMVKTVFYKSQEEAEKKILEFLNFPPIIKLYNQGINCTVDPLVGIKNRDKGAGLVHYFVDESKMRWSQR